MSKILIVAHLKIALVSIIAIIKILINIYKAVKIKNAAGIVYGFIILFICIAIFVFVFDYEEIDALF